MGQKGPF
jgi:hypothetical protein